LKSLKYKLELGFNWNFVDIRQDDGGHTLYLNDDIKKWLTENVGLSYNTWNYETLHNGIYLEFAEEEHRTLFCLSFSDKFNKDKGIMHHQV
jgi:hypothetical protein